EPTLLVHEQVEVPWQVVDLALRPDEARRMADAFIVRPFELAQAPLLRALLLRLGERERVLVLSFHHIVTDGWSQGVLARELRELGRRQGATLHQVLMAGLMVLLWRYTGQTDIAVGTPTAGRSRREVEDLVGFFVNTLVIRAGVRGDDSFERVLAGVREASLGAHAHEEVPFDKLVDGLGVPRDPS